MEASGYVSTNIQSPEWMKQEMNMNATPKDCISSNRTSQPEIPKIYERNPRFGHPFPLQASHLPNENTNLIRPYPPISFQSSAQSPYPPLLKNLIFRSAIQFTRFV